jgi:hypothetical protein
MPMPLRVRRYGFPCHALGDDHSSSELKEVLNTQIDIFADQDRGPNRCSGLRGAMQIHRIAKRRVVHAFRRSKIADHGLPDMDAEPREERLIPRPQLRVEFSLASLPQVLPGKPARRGRADAGAFQNTITASPMNVTVPPSARKASVSAEK